MALFYMSCINVIHNNINLMGLMQDYYEIHDDDMRQSEERQNTDWRKVSRATGGKRIFRNIFNAISCAREKKKIEDKKNEKGCK